MWFSHSLFNILKVFWQKVLLCIFFYVMETNGDRRQESPIVRLKKVSIPHYQRKNSFPRTLDNSPILRKVFAHNKSVLNDTFHAIDSQGKCMFFFLYDH